MSFWIHYYSSKVLRGDQHQFQLPSREEESLQTAHVSGKEAGVSLPKLLGTTTPGTGKEGCLGAGDLTTLHPQISLPRLI